MHDASKDPANNERVLTSMVCMQVRSQDFVQEGTNLVRALGTYPYQKPKTRDLADYFDEPSNFTLVFFDYFILFQYSRQEGMSPPPLASSLQLGVSIPGRFATE